MTFFVLLAELRFSSFFVEKYCHLQIICSGMYHNLEKAQPTIASLLPELSKILCLRDLN